MQRHFSSFISQNETKRGIIMGRKALATQIAAPQTYRVTQKKVIPPKLEYQPQFDPNQHKN